MRALPAILAGGLLCSAVIRGSWCGEWQLRESITDKNKESSPASAFFLKPQGQERTYGIDAAVLYDFQLKSRSTSLFSYASYDRNTAIEVEQDLLTAGFGWERQVDFGRRGWGPVYTATADYKRDGTAGARGARLTTGLTIDSELKGGTAGHPQWYPGSPGPRRAGKYFSWQWEWAAYLQWDKTASAENGGPAGDIFRSFGDLSAYAYPGGDRIKNQVEVELSYRYTWNFDRSRQLDVGDSTVALFRSSLNLYFTEDRKYGLGIDYARGADPVEGLARQTFYRVSFKAQI